MKNLFLKSIFFTFAILIGNNLKAQNYCATSTTNTGDYFSNFSSTSAETNVMFSTSNPPTGYYSDETAQVFEAFASQNFGISYYYNGQQQTVNIWVDWNNDFIFDAGEMILSQPGNGIQTANITIPFGVAQGTYRMRVRGERFSNPPPCGAITWGATIDFNLTVVAPPSCIMPYNLSAISTSPGVTGFSWSDYNGASEWQVEYGLKGFAQGSGNLQSNISTTNYVATVNSGVEYDYYVRTVCGVGDTSLWIGPFQHEYCDVTGFSNSEYIKNITSVGAVTDIYYNTNSKPTNNYADKTSLTFESYETQSFTVITGFKNGSSGVKLWIDWNENLTFEPSELLDYQSGAAINTLNVTVPAGTPQGNYRVRIRGTAGMTGNPSPCGPEVMGSTADFNLTILPIPSCLPPTNLITNSVTTTSAEIGWTDVNGATEWEIEYGAHGFYPSTGFSQGNITTNSYTINTTPGAEYDFYVRSICAVGDTSNWAGPFEYRYCDVPTISSIYYLNGVNSSGAIADVSYTAFSQPSNAYSDQTTQSINSFEGQTFDINTSFFANTNGVNIWVDWNNDKAFDASELVGYEYSANTLKTIPITIPLGIPNGNYRMRVRAESGSTSNPSPCGIVGFGSTVDFNVTIATAPLCLTPSNVMANNIAQTAIELAWTNNGVASLWNIEYDQSGFVLGNGQMTNTVSSNPYIFNNLTPNTSYDFYIQSECGINQSVWTGPFTFTTLSCPIINSTDTQTVCESFTWIDGNTYTTSNNTATYTFVGGAANGCDSTVNLDLRIDPINDAGINNTTPICMNQTIDLDTLISTGSSGIWLDNSNTPITITNITFSGTAGSHVYKYVVSGGVCPTDTALISIFVDPSCDYLSLEKEFMEDISVYPNPATNLLTILNPSNKSSLKIKMLDINGRTVLIENKILSKSTQASIAIDHLEKGIYTLHVYNNEGQKTFKIVKQ